MHLRGPILLSILAALLTLGLKTAAWALTGSVGLLSDALESGINLLAACAALFSLWYSSRPVDASHTYGHEKIEFFSSGLEGGLIVVAALGITAGAIDRLVHPVRLESLGAGTLLAAAAAVINLAVAIVLLRAGRKHHSIVLEADGQHLMTDVWTSVAVVVGVGLVKATGQQWLDPIAALIMAANILWTGFGLLRKSFNGLMDHALPEDELVKLRAAITSRLEPHTTFHALRTRRSGPRRFADCHLLVPGDWPVQQAHDLGERIEAAVRAALPGLELTLHIEPIDAAVSWEDSALLNIEPK
ncbi:MAG: cation diffusion facilitator family transporter [Gemmataceae bacterium]